MRILDSENFQSLLEHRAGVEQRKLENAPGVDLPERSQIRQQVGDLHGSHVSKENFRHQRLPLLNELRNLGVTLSIDDFGTGYSSLNYLATLPIDALKVDRSFIERMGNAGDGNEIVSAIFKLGAALSKQVFAEGIETGEQLRQLQTLGCEFGQGYLLSRPVDAEHAGIVVASRHAPFAAA